MGYLGYELIPGVDCPSFATFLDVSAFVDGEALTQNRSICIWEQPESIALQRHYDNDIVGETGFTFVAGTPKTVLVVRTTATVYNYDYFLSYKFSAEGSIEVSAIASGYLQSDFYPSDPQSQENEKEFSVRVGQHTTGSLHDHLFGYKVDLDVLGRENTLIRNQIGVKEFDVPWNFDGPNRFRKFANITVVPREGADSIIEYDPSSPTMLLFTNKDAPNGGKNEWGVPRSYGIMLKSTVHQLMGDSQASWMPSLQWSKYNVAALRRHESETHSGRPMYDMQGPAQPLVEFDDYLNEESMDQEDLVAWVTVGGMHWPHAEDVPVTDTPGTESTFYIVPRNYFDESAAIDLTRNFFKSGTIYPETTFIDQDNVTLPVDERCYDAVDVPVFGS